MHGELTPWFLSKKKGWTQLTAVKMELGMQQIQQHSEVTYIKSVEKLDNMTGLSWFSHACIDHPSKFN